MGGSSPKPTITPASDQAATQANLNTTAGVSSQAGSMVNQSNPFGNINYTQTGTGPNGVPIYTANVSLAPDQQAILDQLNKGKVAAGTQANQLLSNANYGGSSPADVVGDMTKGMTQQQLNSYLASVVPSQNTQIDRLQTQLANKGLTPGNPAYDQAIRDAYQGINQSNAGAAAGFAGTAFNQAHQLYEDPLQMSLAELGITTPGSPTSQAVNSPGLNIAAPNYIGASANVASEQLQQEQIDNQVKSSMMQGLFGIPTAVLGGWAKSPSGGSAITSGLTSLAGAFI